MNSPSHRDQERADEEQNEAGTPADEIVVDGRNVGPGPIQNPGDDLVDSPALDAEVQSGGKEGGA